MLFHTLQARTKREQRRSKWVEKKQMKGKNYEILILRASMISFFAKSLWCMHETLTSWFSGKKVKNFWYGESKTFETNEFRKRDEGKFLATKIELCLNSSFCSVCLRKKRFSWLKWKNEEKEKSIKALFD